MKKLQGEKDRHRLHLAEIILGLLCALIVLSAFVLRNLEKNLYQERVFSANRLMEKISQNIETVMQSRWDDLDYLSYQILQDADIADLDLEEYLQYMEQHLGRGKNHVLLVDEDAFCHFSDKAYFSWGNLASLHALATDEKGVYVTPGSGIGSYEQEQLIFLTPLPREMTIQGTTYTHIGLIMDMEDLDDYLDSSNYSENGITCIIRKNGTQIYWQTYNNVFASAYNLLETLRLCTFHYGSSFEEMDKGIKIGQPGSVCAEYCGTKYYISYSKLQINDWYAMMMIPEEHVKGASPDFIWSIVGGIGSVSLLAIGSIVIILSVASRYASKQQELVRIQLQKTAEAERSSNQAKTRFLSSMSHDIRTPMNAIVGVTTLAKDHLNDPAYMENALRKIDLAGKHLLTLINDILDISKIESGKMVLKPKEFSIAEMVTYLVNVVRPICAQKNQTIKVHVHDISYEYLWADELRVGQIFLNVLTNAVKYSPEDETISLEVYQKEVAAEDEKVQLVYIVRDHGIGMTREFMETMYESFTRATDSRINKCEGTGLGLTICKQMVDLMKGTITCESEPGKGTTFFITLSLEIARKEEEKEKLPEVIKIIQNSDKVSLYPEHLKDSQRETKRLQGVRILVAEDNNINWIIISEMLEIHGIKVDRAVDGKECVRILEEAPRKEYDLVLMDIRMPVMDGREATRYLRRSEKQWLKGIPILAMTADAFAEDIQECFDAGMNGHISKPIDVEILLTEIESFVCEARESGQVNGEKELSHG